MKSLFTRLMVTVVAIGLFAGALHAAPGDLRLSPTFLPPRIPEVMGQIYLATLNVNPGVVLWISDGAEKLVCARPANNLTSFFISTAIEPNLAKQFPKLLHVYYCNGISERRIWRTGDVPVYNNDAYIREVALGPDKGLYFSEASGAKGGAIWRLQDTGPTSSIYYRVNPAQVGGFWAGHFAFGRDGKLYISNGNTENAAIWQCPVPGGAPISVYKDKGPILGFFFTDRDSFLFTNGSPHLMKAHLGGTEGEVAFTSPAGNRYCDVFVR